MGYAKRVRPVATAGPGVVAGVIVWLGVTVTEQVGVTVAMMAFDVGLAVGLRVGVGDGVREGLGVKLDVGDGVKEGLGVKVAVARAFWGEMVSVPSPSNTMP